MELESSTFTLGFSATFCFLGAGCLGSSSSEMIITTGWLTNLENLVNLGFSVFGWMVWMSVTFLRDKERGNARLKLPGVPRVGCCSCKLVVRNVPFTNNQKMNEYLRWGLETRRLNIRREIVGGWHLLILINYILVFYHT